MQKMRPSSSSPDLLEIRCRRCVRAVLRRTSLKLVRSEGSQGLKTSLKLHLRYLLSGMALVQWPQDFGQKKSPLEIDFLVWPTDPLRHTVQMPPLRHTVQMPSLPHARRGNTLFVKRSRHNLDVKIYVGKIVNKVAKGL